MTHLQEHGAHYGICTLLLACSLTSETNASYYIGPGFGEYTDFTPAITVTVPVPLTTLNLDATINANIQESFGGGFLLGYHSPRKVTFYGRLGGIGNYFKDSASATFGGTTLDAIKSSRYIGAAQIGFGILYPISKRWDYRAEYTYTIYPVEKETFNINFPTLNSTITFSPLLQINAFTMAFLYNFHS